MTYQEYLDGLLIDARVVSDRSQSKRARIDALARLRNKREELLRWNGTLEDYIQELERQSNTLPTELKLANETLATQTELLENICTVLHTSL